MRRHKEKMTLSPELVDSAELGGKPTELEKKLTVSALAEAIGRPLELSHAGEIGASDSGHGVFFAINPEDPTDLSCAIKRFGNREKAQKEIDLLHEADRRGIRTLKTVLDEPLLVPGVKGVNVVTWRVPSLGTMNSVPWSEYYSGQPSYESDIVPIMQSIGKYIGGLHRKGMHHGDMQLKNIGTAPSGEFVTFDLENAYFHPDGEDALEQVGFRDDCVKDLATLIGSLVLSSFMASSSDRVLREQVEKNIILPYMEGSGSLFMLEEDCSLYRNLEECINNRSVINVLNRGRPKTDQLLAHL